MYKKSDKEVWQGRIDSPEDGLGLRWHQVVQTQDLDADLQKQNKLALLGYACDEGVKRNKGRVGAFYGPKVIRKALSSFAWHLDNELLDFGDFECHDSNLEDFQKEFSTGVAKVLSSGHKLVALGGGHDIAYAHFCGFRQFMKTKKKDALLGIINFDAHFDLREPSPLSSSGTPFYQIKTEFSEEKIDYLCLGIHDYANTQRLFHTAKSLGVSYETRKEIRENLPKVEHNLKQFLEPLDAVYLTIDLDGLDASICPGVSAPSTDGLTLVEVLSFIQIIKDSGKLISVDLAEFNPKYDLDNKTAKIAAYLVSQIF